MRTAIFLRHLKTTVLIRAVTEYNPSSPSLYRWRIARNAKRFNGKKKAKSASISRQTMTISKGDKSIITDLCCFCSNQKDLTGVTKCEHYDLYIGKRCPCFIKYPDQAKRMEELFLIRGNEENGE